MSDTLKLEIPFYDYSKFPKKVAFTERLRPKWTPFAFLQYVKVQRPVSR